MPEISQAEARRGINSAAKKRGINNILFCFVFLLFFIEGKKEKHLTHVAIIYKQDKSIRTNFGAGRCDTRALSLHVCSSSGFNFQALGVKPT